MIVRAGITTSMSGRMTYVRDDRPFAGRAPPASVFFYSRDRSGGHLDQHWAGYASCRPMHMPGFNGFCGASSSELAPLALEAVRWIDAISDIELSLNSMPPY
jgi:hypothetical protein